MQIAAADSGVRRAETTQEIIDSPALLALLTQIIGPYTRQVGHSAAVGAIGPVLILIASQFGYTMSADLSMSLSVLLFVGVSYAWQAWSIWRGKVNAPVQPSQPVAGP
jgi:hypothetical protein